MLGWESTELFDPLPSLLSSCHSFTRNKEETSLTGTSILSVVTGNAKLSMSADQYIGLSIPHHFVLLVSMHSSPPLLPFPHDVTLILPLVPPLPLLESVPPWRRPVMSSSSSDKPSLSLTRFYSASGSRKRRPGSSTMLCSRQEPRRQRGQQHREGRQCGCFSGASGGMKGCLLTKTERQWLCKKHRPLEEEWCGVHTHTHTCPHILSESCLIQASWNEAIASASRSGDPTPAAAHLPATVNSVQGWIL